MGFYCSYSFFTSLLCFTFSLSSKRMMVGSTEERNIPEFMVNTIFVISFYIYNFKDTKTKSNGGWTSTFITFSSRNKRLISYMIVHSIWNELVDNLFNLQNLYLGIIITLLIPIGHFNHTFEKFFYNLWKKTKDLKTTW